MEIKVSCACGTNYKFEVEPVHERMPWPVSCPNCGADGTTQANDILREIFAANPAAASLKVNRPVQPAQRVSPPPLVYPQPPPPPKSTPAWLKGVIFLTVFLVVGAGAYKVVRQFGRLANLLSVIENAARGSAEDAVSQWNLTADDGVILYVRHPDHAEVAKACIEYWRDNLHQNLQIVPPESEGEGRSFIVEPAYHGYVRLMGTLDWKEPEFEATAKHLSEKFETMVFEEKDVDFTGEFVFGVYEDGKNLFHARMDMKIIDGEPVDKVTTEHDEWALANGYQPGPKGFEEFDIGDANDLTKRFGMKFWDEPEVENTNHINLLELKK